MALNRGIGCLQGCGAALATIWVWSAVRKAEPFVQYGLAILLEFHQDLSQLGRCRLLRLGFTIFLALEFRSGILVALAVSSSCKLRFLRWRMMFRATGRGLGRTAFWLGARTWSTSGAWQGRSLRRPKKQDEQLCLPLGSCLEIEIPFDAGSWSS